ncbi:MAG: hypothetical protein ACYTFN_05700 [Planctomycetota bacterium]
MRVLPCLLGAVSALTLAFPLDAQTLVVPVAPPAATTGNGANSYPWNRRTSQIRFQQMYAASNFAAIKMPILINRLRFRASDSYGTTSTWTGGTYNGARISMSTAATTHTTFSTTFASNHGTDLKQVFPAPGGTNLGTVTVTAGAGTGSGIPGVWYVDVKLAQTFLFDPTQGKDLVVDIQLNGSWTGGTSASTANYSGTTAQGSRIYSTSSWQATTASGSTTNYTLATEFTYVPAKGLYSDFKAAPMKGPGPLKVQFTDTTYSSSPPVKTWAWDFNGDSKIDSTVQNPTWTYPKTTWDAQYDVTLTTTDGTHPASKVTKKGFITVDPSDAFTVDFGKGSTNKPLAGPIGLSPYSSTYSSTTAVRGFYFVAPTAFLINGFEAPNTYKPAEPNQTVTCYVINPPPTGAHVVKAADIKFHGTGKANTVLKPTVPILVNKGDWVGVLGSCHGTAATSSHRNSYGAGSHKTTVLGQAITLNRLWMNSSDPRVNKGMGTINPSTGSLGRNFIHVVNNIVNIPTLTTIGKPSLGTTPQLDMKANQAGAQGGILLAGSGRLASPVRVLFGDLLIKGPWIISWPIPSGTGKVSIPIPMDNRLKGVIVDFQGLAYNNTTNTFGLTNGTEWFAGK